MRLWTLHPKYLDPRGLVALWREALLAQAVLKGQTSGYKHHPQLIRFRNTSSPTESIASYLQEVFDESCRRGYCFDESKIASTGNAVAMTVTRGQLDYEVAHLKKKLQTRAPSWLVRIQTIKRPISHPLFRIVPGPVEEWEVNSYNFIYRNYSAANRLPG
ncbi:MAG: hypothetical protein H6Q42_3674 [Deltaproteobacteria bacterium]|nr:hypothetical protein [Deltaproteobacteria bacterium]